jgi:ABC-2 type transport system ATP-binding protein
VRFAVETSALTMKYARPRSLSAVLGGRATPPVMALSNVALAIEEGEVFGLLGPNGSGKTTFLKLLSTLLSPTSGTARIFGVDVVREPRRVRQLVSLVTGDERSLYWRLTARQNLEFFSSLCGLHHGARRRIDELLDLFDLAHVAETRVSGFSTGMRQRLLIARGLLSSPKLLFLDEPTRGLDPVAAHNLLNLVRERAVDRYDNTVILTTHIAREVDQLCRRIAMLNRGTVVYEGTVDDLRTSLERGQVYRLTISGMTPDFFEALRLRSGLETCRLLESTGTCVEVEISFTDASAQLSDVLRQVLFSGANILQCTRREQSFEEILRTVFTQGGVNVPAHPVGAAAPV